MVQYDIERGVRALYLPHFGIPREKELLLPRWSKFTYLGSSKGTVYLGRKVWPVTVYKVRVSPS